jgi:aldehyde dehydrogenase (NAD+)
LLREAAVFVNVKNDMTIAREEIFVHVLSVIAYDSEDEAISIANDSKYGLQIWSSRRRHRNRPPPRAPRGLSVAGRPGRDQRHDGRSAGALGWIQILRRRREYGRYGIEALLETCAILEA